MKSSDLLKHWEQHFGDQVADREYCIPLKTKDAARIEALCDMFPSSTREQILRDLVSAALNDLASDFPYQAGDKVVARDEEGDPIYEDAGLTPQFLKLTRRHLTNMQQDKH